ncbi:MAG: PAS domain S-box protein [Mariniblastus sp.]
MKIAKFPDNERARINALERYGILDTPPDAVFDSITQATANACEMPVALISLIDRNRQWFKSCVGLDVNETTRDVAFCAHAINNPTQLLEVEDATKDPRFSENPLVTGEPGIRFYAGMPLVTPDGLALGSLCIIDFKPRRLSASQRNTIKNLSNAIIALFEERRHSPVAAINNAIEETLKTGLLVIDPKVEGNPIIYCNRGFETITGYNKSEIIGNNWRFLQGPESDPAPFDAVQLAIQEEQECVVTVHALRKNGSLFWNEVSLSPIRDACGNLTHFLEIHSDITDRRIAEDAVQESHDLLEQRVTHRTAELEESEERYRELFENASDLIQCVSPDGKFIYVNPAWIKTLGYEESDLDSINIFDIIHEDSKPHCSEIFQEVMSAGKADNIEATFVTKDGKSISVVGNATCQFKNNKPYATRAIFHDVTAFKTAEDSLRKAKEVAERATEMKSKFLAAASHDLRQPLQAVGLYVSALSEMAQGDDQQTVCNKIRHTLGSVRELLDALLDVSKLETGSVTPNIQEFPVQEILNRLAIDNEPEATRKGLEFTSKNSNCVVRSDPALLRRILDNFVGNAIRYTDRGSVTVECLTTEDRLRIQVKDTGTGIPSDAFESIFDDFVQLDNPMRERNEGVGMGLSIVKHIARLLGHRLNVESTVGKGSTFSIEVPIVSHAHSEAKESGSVDLSSASGQPLVVLFVDDDDRIIDATQLRMSSLDAQVHFATSAEAAIGLVEEGLRPNILITDYHLAKLNGLELIRHVRSISSSQMSAVLLTGNNLIVQGEIDRHHDCTILHKPIDEAKLLSIIQNV